jgi:hypothetical protein
LAGHEPQTKEEDATQNNHGTGKGEYLKEKILVYPIKYGSNKQVIKVRPLMDLHKGAKTCDMRAFREWLKEHDENTYYYTNGDLWDMIFFDDKRFRLSGHEAMDGEDDDPIDIEVREMAELLNPIKGNIICVGTGNHEDVIAKRCKTNPSKRLAELIGVPYMGYSFWFRLALSWNGGSGRTVDFFSTHGFGGGTRTEGGSVTKYSKFSDRFLCDVFVAGHDHRKQYVRYPLLGITGKKNVSLFSKSKIVCLGGSWKKTYGNGTAVTWEETKGFPPGEIGGITIEIKPSSTWVKMNVSM